MASTGEALGVAVKRDGTPVSVGNFQGTSTFATGPNSSVTLTSLNGRDGYIAAMSTDDSYFAWVQQIKGTSHDRPMAITFSRDDTPVITGRFAGTAYFPTGPGPDDSIALQSPDGDNVFVAVMNADDSYFAWAQSAGGADTDLGDAVDVSRDDTIVIAGNFRETIYFPTGRAAPDDSIALTTSGGEDAFVAGLSMGDSYFDWALKIGGSGWENGTGVAVNASGEALVTGPFNGTITLPTGQGTSVSLTSLSNSTDGFIAAVRPDGSSFIWAQRMGSSSTDYPHGITIAGGDSPSGSNIPIITGQYAQSAEFPTSASTKINLSSATSWYGNDIFVAAMVPNSPYFSWVQGAGGMGGSDAGLSVAVIDDDTPVIAGHFNYAASFPKRGGGSIELTAPNTNLEVFVAALNADDSYFAWAQSAGGSGSDIAHAVAITRGAPVVAGQVDGAGLFPVGPNDSLSVTSGASSTAFLGVIGPFPIVSAPGAPNSVVGTGLNASASIAFAIPQTGDSLSRVEFALDDTLTVDDSTTNVVSPHVISGLVNGQAYRVYVRGVNSAGAGPWSNASNLFTPRTAPSAPTGVSALAGNASATVTATIDDTGGSPLTRIDFALDDTNSVFGSTTNVTSPYPLTGLTNGRTYRVYVRAANAAGDGPWSVASNSFTPMDPPPPQYPPYAPTLDSVTAGNGRVAVRWTRAYWESTPPVSEYRVYTTGGRLVCTVPATWMSWYGCTVAGLVNGTKYDFWVVSVNGVGESEPSRTLSATPIAEAPLAPNFTSLVGGHRQATATWYSPASDGGSSITEYRVYASSVGQVCTVPAAEGPPYSCTITGLTNYVSYSMWIKAVNRVGLSPESRRLSVIPAPLRPGPPRDLTGRSGISEIEVSWEPPADEGTFPVESYQVWLEPGGASCTVAAPRTSCTMTKVVPGESYRTRVRAWSKAGWGYLSEYGPTLTVPVPSIGYPEVRRDRQNPTQVTVTTPTTGIKPGTVMITIPQISKSEYNYPIVREDGSFVWKATVPLNEVWYIYWCVSDKRSLCSPRTLLIDPTYG